MDNITSTGPPGKTSEDITLKIIAREKSIVTSEPNGGGRIGGGSSNEPHGDGT